MSQAYAGLDTNKGMCPAIIRSDITLHHVRCQWVFALLLTVYSQLSALWETPVYMDILSCKHCICMKHHPFHTLPYSTALEDLL